MYPEWKSSAVNPDNFIENYTNYNKEDLLDSLLKGKKVAVVGPSSHIFRKKLGNYIDSFDVVVKVGFLRNPSDIESEDYGSRHDIVVHSFNCFEIPVANNNIDYLLKSKCVICGMVSNDYIEEHENFFNKLRDNGLPVYNMEDSYLYGFFRRVGTICNLGLVAIEMILQYEIESLFVTGINFYNMGKYGDVYGKEYYDMVSDDMGIYKKNFYKEVSSESAREDLHAQEPQIKYFRDLVKNDKRIILDEYLKSNL